MLKSSSVVLLWVKLAALSASARNAHDEADQTTRRTQTSPSSGFRSFFQNIWPMKFLDCFNVDGVASNFTITLDLLNVNDDSVFKRASDAWSSVIVGDIKDFAGTLGGQSDCGAWPNQVDDVYICGQYRYIDGPGKILGNAGPRHYRPTEGIPLTGVMSFEQVDIEDGRIQDLFGVILHEMAHVLGIGALWTVKKLASSSSAPCTYASNSAATREYQSISGCSSSIPLEQGASSSAGSNCGHWAESCFLNEVMTTAANSHLPISRLTIAGLEDLGYTVDYSAADAFGASDMDPSCLCGDRRRMVRKLSGPARQLSSDGQHEAITYGQEILAQNKQQMSFLPDSDGAVDIGGDVVFVLYLENETVYSIMVTPFD